MAVPCRRLFAGRPMPDLQLTVPPRTAGRAAGLPAGDPA
jgi:hypothetical protein